MCLQILFYPHLVLPDFALTRFGRQGRTRRLPKPARNLSVSLVFARGDRRRLDQLSISASLMRSKFAGKRLQVPPFVMILGRDVLWLRTSLCTRSLELCTRSLYREPGSMVVLTGAQELAV